MSVFLCGWVLKACSRPSLSHQTHIYRLFHDIKTQAPQGPTLIYIYIFLLSELSEHSGNGFWEVIDWLSDCSGCWSNTGSLYLDHACPTEGTT